MGVRWLVRLRTHGSEIATDMLDIRTEDECGCQERAPAERAGVSEVLWGVGVAGFLIPSPRKLTNSRFTSSAWVQVMQCGPPFTTNKRAPFISLAVRSPEAPIGTIRSA